MAFLNFRQPALRRVVQFALLVAIALPGASAVARERGAGAGLEPPASTVFRSPRPQAAIPDARTVPSTSVLGIISGGLAGTYVRIAADIATVLDAQSSQLRVLPIVGVGSLQNISDILNVRDVDVGIVQSDVLSFLRQKQGLAGLEQSISYVAKLYDEEVHILARPDIASVADLAGKRVNVDMRGSGTALTASVIFDALGAKAELVNDDQDTALAKLKRGEIAALVYVAGKPARLFTELGSSGLHLLPIPLNAALLETYLPSRFDHADYPALVPDGASVETVAVGAVMAVYNWTPGTERYTRLARFVDSFFDSLPALQAPPHHPKWRQVSFSARVPGWTRFRAAQLWLDRHGATPAIATRASLE